MRRATWMADLGSTNSNFANTPLNQLVLPGTHDSATSSIPPDPSRFSNDYAPQEGYFDAFIKRVPPRTTAAFSKAQDLPVLQQLLGGIRYLDLRIAAKSGTTSALWTYHTLYSDPIYGPGGILDQIHSFAVSAPRELLLLDFQEFNFDVTPQQASTLYSNLQNLFAGMLLPPGTGCRATLQQVWATGGPRILIFCPAVAGVTLPSAFWPRDAWIQSRWFNSDDPAVLRTGLPRELNNRNMSKFLVLQGVLTPSDSKLAGNAVYLDESLLTLSDLGSRALVEVTNTPSNLGKLNIGIVDYFERSNLVDASVAVQKGLQWMPNVVAMHRGGGSNTSLAAIPYDGTYWAADEKIPQPPATNSPAMETSVSPALGILGSTVYCVYKANDNSGQMRVSKSTTGLWNDGIYNDGTDNGNSPIVTNPTSLTQDGPALATLGGNLYCAFRSYDTSGQLYYIATSNGSTWSNPQKIWVASNPSNAQPASTNGPALVGDTANNLLVCAFRGASPPPNAAVNPPGSTSNAGGLYWAIASPSGSNLSWTGVQLLSTNLGTTVSTLFGPGLAILGTTLCCVYTDASTLWWATLDISQPNYFTAQKWQVGQIPGQVATARPALVQSGGKLHCLYRGRNPTDGLYYTASTDGRNWQVPGSPPRSFQFLDNRPSADGPALSVNSGQILWSNPPA